MLRSQGWIFSFSLSKNVHFKDLNDGFQIMFITEDHYLKGFKITMRGLDFSSAQLKSKKKATNLQRLLTIKSGMDVEAYESAYEEIRSGNHAVASTLTSSYEIEGSIDKLDLDNNSIIHEFVNSHVNEDLVSLSNAVSLLYHG